MAGIETNERIPDRLEIPERYRKKYPTKEHALKWCNETIIRRKGNRGWVPCEKDKDDPFHKHDPDTRIKEGDLFLCHMPRSLSDANERRKQYLKNNRMKAVRTQAAAAAASRGYLAQLGSKPTSSTGYQGAMPTDDFSIGAHDQGLDDKPSRDPVEHLRKVQEAAEVADQTYKDAGLTLDDDPMPKTE